MSRKESTADRQVLRNAAKTLLANIRFASVDTPIRTVVITSSVPNEGKSTVAIELAHAIATGGNRVLLVEADMRRRTLADFLGVHAKYGLYAVLTEQVPFRAAVMETPVAKLDFLDAEPHIPNPADLLASKRYARLIATMEQDYDYVIFDTPPVGTFVDAAVLAARADATALVVREGYTKRADLLAAYEQLQKAEANVIGAVMNFCKVESTEYYYAYYNKEGKRVRKSNASTPSAPSLPERRGSRGFVDPLTAEAADGGAGAQEPVRAAGVRPVIDRAGRAAGSSRAAAGSSRAAAGSSRAAAGPSRPGRSKNAQSQ